MALESAHQSAMVEISQVYTTQEPAQVSWAHHFIASKNSPQNSPESAYVVLEEIQKIMKLLRVDCSRWSLLTSDWLWSATSGVSAGTARGWTAKYCWNSIGLSENHAYDLAHSLKILNMYILPQSSKKKKTHNIAKVPRLVEEGRQKPLHLSGCGCSWWLAICKRTPQVRL